MLEDIKETISLEEEIVEDEGSEVEDEASQDDTVAPVSYNITTYGADYDVEGLVNRLKRGDILIPSFQRNYVWSQPEASRFIESLLLGLPIPAIFLAKEVESNKFLVIDGQQRLKTLQFFYGGYFNSQENSDNKKVFKLSKVQKPFDGLTYEMLDEENKRKLNDSLIHAIIVKQDFPQDNNTSIYHIFDRLNSRGMSLTTQEIRSAVDHGKFIDMIQKLNDYDSWRKVYGRKNNRLKDQEMMLRFFAFYFAQDKYERPMKEFLNKFSQKNRNANQEFLDSAIKIFTSTIDLVFKSIGRGAFRPKNQINAAVFDSVMVGIARRIQREPLPNLEDIKRVYDELIKDSNYIKIVSQSTSDEQNVSERFRLAYEKFNSI